MPSKWAEKTARTLFAEIADALMTGWDSSRAIALLTLALDAARAEEREACAKVAESFRPLGIGDLTEYGEGADNRCTRIAAAIRARKP